jgi:hypothetical protein
MDNGACAIGAVANLVSVLVEQHTTGTAQQRMASSIVDPARAVQRYRGHTVTSGNARQPVGDARHANEPRRRDRHPVGDRTARRIMVQEHD